MKNFLVSVVMLMILSSYIFGQPKTIDGLGVLYRFELSNSMFPHPDRMNGHVYRDQTYSFEDHYNDSTALVFVPDYVSLNDSFEIIIYIHGWWNNVDASLEGFKLAEQLHASKRNAILILPEGPKNSADSFGGKLEETGRFRLLIEETLSHLLLESNRLPESFNYILAGHSGAGHVMGYILMLGGLTDQIKEVYLFDGLYEDVEKYTYWMDHYNGRFINIYTPDGGTKRESEKLMVSLKAWGIPFKHIESDDFTNAELTTERIVMIQSKLGHNDVISAQDQFKRFLETGK